MPAKNEKSDKANKSAAKKPSSKPSVAKTQGTKASSPASAPMVDTGLAAAAAARSLIAKLPAKSDGSGASRTESSMFKQLKSGMAKPAGQTMSNLLDKHGGPIQKSSHEGFGSGGQQLGKNQTFGADVNRTGVPRRTGGG